MLFSLRRDKRTIMTSILALSFSKLNPESNAHNAEQIVVLSGTKFWNFSMQLLTTVLSISDNK
jgi:hypothetical protein